MRLTDPLINGRKNLLVHKALGEAKNSVFQEETVLSQAMYFQWDNGTDIKSNTATQDEDPTGKPKVPLMSSAIPTAMSFQDSKETPRKQRQPIDLEAGSFYYPFTASVRAYYYNFTF
ncbi:hypothetical protein TNCV_3634821 [Trichonephila clavipes]|nr:hypothetical protein TNCV_3634821 [Trichonephila clavipes]